MSGNPLLSKAQEGTPSNPAPFCSSSSSNLGLVAFRPSHASLISPVRLQMGCSSSRGTSTQEANTGGMVTGVPKANYNKDDANLDELGDEAAYKHKLILNKNQRSIEGRQNQVCTAVLPCRSCRVCRCHGVWDGLGMLRVLFCVCFRTHICFSTKTGNKRGIWKSPLTLHRGSQAAVRCAALADKQGWFSCNYFTLSFVIVVAAAFIACMDLEEAV